MLASRRRTAAAASWVREAFAEARILNASAVVLSFHANAELESPADAPYRQAFEPFITAIEEEAERFATPGAARARRRPRLHRRSTAGATHDGATLENVTRLQVPGSPAVGWVRVVVTPGAADPFAFEAHVVPRWKYW